MIKNNKKKFKFEKKNSINRGLFFQSIISILIVIIIIGIKKYNSESQLIKNLSSYLNQSYDLSSYVKDISQNSNYIMKDIKDILISKYDFVAPVSGEIIKSYGMNEDNNKYSHGIDIKSNIYNIKSVSDGIVKKIGSNPNINKYIVIESGGKEILYSRINEIYLEEGDRVLMGQIIGELEEEEGLLHVEIWENGKSINPSKLFKLYQ